MDSQLIKGMVSRDFGSIFFLSLDRYEVRNRAGEGLVFILMTFSNLNCRKIFSGGKDPL
jgi:hypothetical protein